MLAKQLEDKTEPEDKGQLNPNSSLRNIAYWESSLFSKVYLENDLKRDFSEKWESDFDDVVFDENGDTVKSGFYHFYNEFRNIAESLRGLSKKKLKETDTITKIITPLLDALGWFDNCSNNVEEPFAAETPFTVNAKPKNKSYRTDMILVDYPQEAGFINATNDIEKIKREARQYCIAPLEAKYWNRILEKEKSNIKEDSERANKKADDTNPSATFNEQILNYMDILHSKWGIITDGNIWRLLNKEISGEDPRRCFEFKLESLLTQESKIEAGDSDDTEFMENAKLFYLFFGKSSYVRNEVGKVFLDEVLKESRKYIDSIEEDLKDRFISAMNYMCDGLLREAKKTGTITRPTKEDLDLIRTVAESHLFNILFIKSCEAKGILPIKSPEYYKMSLTGIIDRISVFDPEKYTRKTDMDYINMRLTKSLKAHKFKPDGKSLYKNLVKLTEVIHDGTKGSNFGFEIAGFQETVFSKEECAFAKKHSLDDIDMVRIFFELGYSKPEKGMQRDFQQIPYNYFTPRQLGSIYESFLEYKLDVAQEPMVYLKKCKYKQWIKLTSAISKKLKGHEPVAQKGSPFFTPDNTDRKATGSYYTPDYIVQYLVKNTIGVLVKNKSSKDILKLKICDPAMGSGHFLIASLNYLTACYVNALEAEVSTDQIPSKLEAKREILDKCIFGIDINHRAVKLAKMSLWLESAHWGRKLERLDDQLVHANTVTSETPWKEYPGISSGGFSAVIGNPPYIGEQGNKNIFDILKTSHFGNEFYVPKMDIFYFFFHKAIQFLKEQGRLGFITTNYFPTTNSGQKLRKALYNCTEVKEIIDFGNLKIFDAAGGQHNMITIAERSYSPKENSQTSITVFKSSGKCTELDFRQAINKEATNIFSSVKRREELFDGPEKYIRIRDLGSGNLKDINSLLDKLSENERLSKKFNVYQGIVTGANKVTERLLKDYSTLTSEKGDGIFVLSANELKNIKLTKDERSLIKPFYKNSSINQFHCDLSNQEHLIFIPKEYEEKMLIKEYVGIYKHLSKFKTVIIDKRRKLKEREDKWFTPNRGTAHPEIFEGPKIVAPQWAKENVFGYNDGSWYGASDCIFIVPKKDENRAKELQYLSSILNSKLMYFWLFHKGKRKGDLFEMTRTPVSNAIFKYDQKLFKDAASFAESLSLNGWDNKTFASLNKIVYEIFGLTATEVKVVEEFYLENKVPEKRKSIAEDEVA